MSLQEQLSRGFSKLIQKAGRPITIKYFTSTIGSVWDDEVTWAQSGNTVNTSGIVLPLDETPGSWDSILVNQGKLFSQDHRLFISGGFALTGSEMAIRIGFGGEEYTTRPIGVIAPEAEGQKIYKKVYLTRLTLGSLLGE